MKGMGLSIRTKRQRKRERERHSKNQIFHQFISQMLQRSLQAKISGSGMWTAGTQILGPSSAAIRDGHVQETASEVGEGIEPRHSEMDASVPVTNLTPELNATPVLGIVTL